MTPRGTDRRSAQRKNLWERWSTRLAVVCATLALFGVGLYSQSFVSPQHATWQGKTTSLLREIGFSPPIDRHPGTKK
ncbi:MAG: hypothetical protein ABWY93_08655 [Mycobacterium sp.]